MLSLALAMVALPMDVGQPYTWTWDPSPSDNVDGYRLRWSATPHSWPAANMVETDQLFAEDNAPDPEPGGCTYYVVTAFNENGESETGHGEII